MKKNDKKDSKQRSIRRPLYNLGLIVVIILSIIFLIISVFLYFRMIFDPTYFNSKGDLNIELASEFGSFFGGLIGTTAGIAGSLLIVLVFLIQNKQAKITQLENIYFKLIDCHNENVKNLTITDYRRKNKEKILGRRAFVIFKLQIFDCLDLVEELDNEYDNILDNEEIIDIAYMVFYYGLSDKWEEFSKNIYLRYLKKIPEIHSSLLTKVKEKKRIHNINLGRTNQTSLSAYFRNFSNAIMIIHNTPLLSKKQKYEYVKILRSQLCNSEQLVLYFNVMSRFGKDWNENNLLQDYSLIKNLPINYIDARYDFRKYYKLRYEDEDYN